MQREREVREAETEKIQREGRSKEGNDYGSISRFFDGSDGDKLALGSGLFPQPRTFMTTSGTGDREGGWLRVMDGSRVYSAASPGTAHR